MHDPDPTHPFRAILVRLAVCGLAAALATMAHGRISPDEANSLRTMPLAWLIILITTSANLCSCTTRPTAS